MNRAWLAAAIALSACVDPAPQMPAAATDEGALELGDLGASYAWQTEEALGDGVWAVLGKGGNSVVVSDGTTLLFDTKFDNGLFARGASSLERWVHGQSLPPVTQIVNSHFHYDHTWGNTLYPGAEVYADPRSRERMLAVDPGVWGVNGGRGLPTRSLSRFWTTLNVGEKSVEARLVGPGHTAGDAIVRIPRESLGEGARADVIATGDLIFHTFYPFFEEGEEGSSLEGNIATLRELATTYPDARFVPGHGPVCGRDDLLAYANYLEEMLDEITSGLALGLDEDAIVRRVDPGRRWRRLMLPSPHGGAVAWATAESSFRSAIRVVRGGR